MIGCDGLFITTINTNSKIHHQWANSGSCSGSSGGRDRVCAIHSNSGDRFGNSDGNGGKIGDSGTGDLVVVLVVMPTARMAVMMILVAVHYHQFSER